MNVSAENSISKSGYNFQIKRLEILFYFYGDTLIDLRKNRIDFVCNS